MIKMSYDLAFDVLVHNCDPQGPVKMFRPVFYALHAEVADIIREYLPSVDDHIDKDTTYFDFVPMPLTAYLDCDDKFYNPYRILSQLFMYQETPLLVTNGTWIHRDGFTTLSDCEPRALNPREVNHIQYMDERRYPEWSAVETVMMKNPVIVREVYEIAQLEDFWFEVDTSINSSLTVPDKLLERMERWWARVVGEPLEEWHAQYLSAGVHAVRDGLDLYKADSWNIDFDKVPALREYLGLIHMFEGEL